MSIKVDFTKKIAKIKPIHGVGQPPFYGGASFPMFRYLSEAGMPFSRLHDVGGFCGGGRFVDIPNLFRNFDADPKDPASYDFTFTDRLITALVEAGVEPYFRLGVTIENDCKIKAYNIHPPKDFGKWAMICEMVIRHYTEGWADGFHYNIRYWEIWNEPDGNPDPQKNMMWTGTKEQFFELYHITATHLKKCFPHLKIGGYGSCGFHALSYKDGNVVSQYYLDFFDDFLAYIKEHGSPIDFFSWHSYSSIEFTMTTADHAKKRLVEEGFTNVETHCNEWNPEVALDKSVRGTGRHAALCTGMMLAMQDSPLDSAMFYDARWGVSIYGSLFNPLTAEPFPAYYGFIAFNELYKREDQVMAECDAENVYISAAVKDRDGYIIIANTNRESVKLDLEMNAKIKKCKIIDGERFLEDYELGGEIPANTVICIEAEI